MENLIYWENKAVGIDCGTYVSWFPSAPMEAIMAFPFISNYKIGI